MRTVTRELVLSAAFALSGLMSVLAAEDFSIDGFLNDDYSVRLNGRGAEVRASRESHIPFNRVWPGHQRSIDQTERASYVLSESAGPVDVAVTVKHAFSNVVVRPLSAGVKPVVSGQNVTFTLPKPGHYVLETLGPHKVLYLFVERPRDFAEEKAAATRMFGPGRHFPVVVELKDHDRVYIDRDAVVFGCFRGVEVKDVRISGYGVICGRIMERVSGDGYKDTMPACLRFARSKDITVDGPVLMDSPEWTLGIFACEDVTVSNVKIIGQWRYNTDGIDVCNSSRVRISDSFVRSFDDTISLKGIAPYAGRPLEDVTVERCILWSGWGKTIEPGIETWASAIRRLRFADCDLVRNSFSAINISGGGPGVFEDVTFENLRVELQNDTLPEIYQASEEMRYDPKGEKGRPMLVKIDNRPWMYYYNVLRKGEDVPVAYGHIRNCRLKNIRVFAEEGVPPPQILVKSWAAEGTSPRPFENVLLEDFSLNGRPAAAGDFSFETNLQIGLTNTKGKTE